MLNAAACYKHFPHSSYYLSGNSPSHLSYFCSPVTIMGLLGSGGSTTPPQNWWADLPSSSPQIASLSPAVTISLFSSLALLIPLLPTVVLIIFLFLFFYRYDTIASFLHPTTMAIDPQADFAGDIKVNNNPPTKATLEKIAHLPVLDANKKSRTFKSLYADNEDGPRRVLICFIRHFFCGVRSPLSFPSQKIK